MKKIVLWGCFALAVGGAAPAAAKVVFTGYGDIRLSPQTVSSISGPQPVLDFLNVTKRRSESRSFSMDSLGLFATTTFDEKTDFLMDVTYKKIGATVGETRIQYAYLDYHPAGWEAKVGRVTIPIGYYNRHFFYPFQHYAVTPPLFQSAIIGLPIADHGLILSKTLDAGPVEFEGIVYAVNGYGPSKTSTDTFRAGLGATDALLIANNLRDTNPNNKFAFGGNGRVAFFKDRNVKVGVSSYQGAWSPDGKRNFTMLNAYLVVEAGPAELLAEGLRTHTDGDGGVVGFFGARDWGSAGGFLEASLRLMKNESGELVLFAGTEGTSAEGKSALATGRERLIQHKGGLSWRISPDVLIKSQFSLLEYQLPIQLGGAGQEVRIRQNQVLLGLTLTY